MTLNYYVCLTHHFILRDQNFLCFTEKYLSFIQQKVKITPIKLTTAKKLFLYTDPQLIILWYNTLNNYIFKTIEQHPQLKTQFLSR